MQVNRMPQRTSGKDWEIKTLTKVDSVTYSRGFRAQLCLVKSAYILIYKQVVFPEGHLPLFSSSKKNVEMMQKKVGHKSLLGQVPAEKIKHSEHGFMLYHCNLCW